jgi:hypothetical protein
MLIMRLKVNESESVLFLHNISCAFHILSVEGGCRFEEFRT